jgi:hypothetical protein
MFRAVGQLRLTLLFGTCAGFLICGFCAAESTNQHASSLTADETGITSVERPLEVPYIRIDTERSQRAALFFKTGLEDAGATCALRIARSEAPHPATGGHSIETRVPVATLVSKSTRLQI